MKQTYFDYLAGKNDEWKLVLYDGRKLITRILFFFCLKLFENHLSNFELYIEHAHFQCRVGSFI